MNYLKKYRRDAGLTQANENSILSSDRNPTKETLAYLSGVLKSRQVPVPVLASQNSTTPLKSRALRQSPYK